MAFPTDDGEFILDTQIKTIGAVLTQILTGVDSVITYCSQTLGTSKKNYCANDRELLVNKYFVE